MHLFGGRDIRSELRNPLPARPRVQMPKLPTSKKGPGRNLKIADRLYDPLGHLARRTKVKTTRERKVNKITVAVVQGSGYQTISEAVCEAIADYLKKNGIAVDDAKETQRESPGRPPGDPPVRRRACSSDDCCRNMDIMSKRAFYILLEAAVVLGVVLGTAARVLVNPAIKQNPRQVAGRESHD